MMNKAKSNPYMTSHLGCVPSSTRTLLILTWSWCHSSWCAGSVAEGSKALDLGSSLFGGVGSNPTTANSLSLLFRNSSTQHIDILSYQRVNPLHSINMDTCAENKFVLGSGRLFLTVNSLPTHASTECSPSLPVTLADTWDTEAPWNTTAAALHLEPLLWKAHFVLVN